MITIVLKLDKDSAVASLSIEGHGGRSVKGRDLVCAAVSIMVRTAYETLSTYKGLEVSYAARQEGSFSIVLKNIPLEYTEKIIGVTDFMLTGFSSLSREFPGEIKLTIERHWRA